MACAPSKKRQTATTTTQPPNGAVFSCQVEPAKGGESPMSALIRTLLTVVLPIVLEALLDESEKEK